jgi:hypothetical protein
MCPVLSSPGRAARPVGGSSSLQASASLFLRLIAVLLRFLVLKLSAAAGRLDWVRLKHLDFALRPDDIFIVTYPRSGTTWLQMILYQLTTDGTMDFPHIAQRSPWFERSLRPGKGFAALPSPRVFKSHLPYRAVPRGPCKYIYVARDGKDVAVSYYHLYVSHMGYKGSFAEFFDLFVRGRTAHGSWFRHVKGWWEHRHEPNVLFLRYEDLLGDLEGNLRRIAAFCGLDVPAERWPAIVERCGFAFMKRHEAQFDDLTGQLWEQGFRLNAFLRHGGAGGWREHLTPEQRARFDRASRRQLGGLAGPGQPAKVTAERGPLDTIS